MAKTRTLSKQAELWVILLLLFVPTSGPGSEHSNEGGRRLTVKDTIEMTVWANRGYAWNGAPDSPVALFSPNRSQFIVSVKKGNIAHDAMESSLLLFESKNSFLHPQPRVLVTMSSASNRDAIQRVVWLDDRRVAFLGEALDGTRQIYTIETASGRLQKLTNHPTPIVSFDISKQGGVIVYEAIPELKSITYSQHESKPAIVISTQRLSDLLRSEANKEDETADRELFVMKMGEPAKKVPGPYFLTEYLPLSISRTGRYAVIAAYLQNVPDEWRAYKEKLLHLYVSEPRRRGTVSSVLQFLVVDTTCKNMSPLIDAPLSWRGMGFAFAPDEKSVAVSGTYLPLGVQEPEERSKRESKVWVAEITLPDRNITKISEAELKVKSWVERTGKLILESEDSRAEGKAFERIDSKWTPVDIETSQAPGELTFDVTLEEDMNTAPKIFASSKGRQEKTLLLDLNPEFASMKLGRVENVRWRASDGHELEGGLYLPPDYTPERRYPVVLQTHGFRSDRFQINGPYNSAYAAQPLAAHGIVVLQVGRAEPGEDEKYVNTIDEAPRQMAVFEGAIEYLDSRSIVDRSRVGLLGFSRTAFYVAFTLTHSKYPFAAAELADGFEAGFMNYLLWPNADYPGVIGAQPTGTGLEYWLRNSPGFNLDKVNTPVHLENYGPVGVLAGWQWYSGLGLLHKPVDFVWLPRGSHLLARPSDRLASQGGTVDWFSYWLLGWEDPDNTKHAQYERWKSLKDEFKLAIQ